MKAPFDFLQESRIVEEIAGQDVDEAIGKLLIRELAINLSKHGLFKNAPKQFPLAKDTLREIQNAFLSGRHDLNIEDIQSLWEDVVSGVLEPLLTDSPDLQNLIPKIAVETNPILQTNWRTELAEEQLLGNLGGNLLNNVIGASGTDGIPNAWGFIRGLIRLAVIARTQTLLQARATNETTAIFPNSSWGQPFRVTGAINSKSKRNTDTDTDTLSNMNLDTIIKQIAAMSKSPIESLMNSDITSNLVEISKLLRPQQNEQFKFPNGIYYGQDDNVNQPSESQAAPSVKIQCSELCTNKTCCGNEAMTGRSITKVPVIIATFPELSNRISKGPLGRGIDVIENIRRQILPRKPNESINFDALQSTILSELTPLFKDSYSIQDN